MAPIPMVPKLWGPPGLLQQTDTAQGSSVRVRVADGVLRVIATQWEATYAGSVKKAGEGRQ